MPVRFLGVVGAREVYEEKLRTGNLCHDPTMNLGLGSPRCPHCLSLINPNSGNGEWMFTSVLYNATAVAGSEAGAMFSAVHGFNRGIPVLQKHVKGPKWLHFFIGGGMSGPAVRPTEYDHIKKLRVSSSLPPLLLFSGASAAFGAYAVPKLSQLTVTSYYAASSASHHAISQITRYVEGANSSHHLHDKPTE